MSRRTKLRIITAGLFCIGVLIGGIGTGIAFNDFSGFAYRLIPSSEESFQTKTFTYQIQPEDSERIWMLSSFGEGLCTIEDKAEIPKDQVEITVVYNSELCDPYMTTRTDAESELWIQLYMEYLDNEMESFMKYKDQFLEGLRNREIRDYREEYIRSVVYRVNPETHSRLYIN